MKTVKRKVTIKDVATVAGVSPTTVSMVLNEKKVAIPESTCARVRSVAKELDYSFNFNARALITKKTNIIGVIVPDISNSFFAE